MSITLTNPLVGLEPLTEFELHPLAGAPGAYSFRSVERPEVRLFVLDAAEKLPDWRAALPVSADADVYVIVTSHQAGLTVNLLSPIVIDNTTGITGQVILDAGNGRIEDLVRTPLTSAA